MTGLVLIIGVIGILFYFLPTINAISRKHYASTGIIIVNLLFGWTVIGWIVALIWSYSEKKN